MTNYSVRVILPKEYLHQKLNKHNQKVIFVVKKNKR